MFENAYSTGNINATADFHMGVGGIVGECLGFTGLWHTYSTSAIIVTSTAPHASQNIQVGGIAGVLDYRMRYQNNVAMNRFINLTVDQGTVSLGRGVGKLGSDSSQYGTTYAGDIFNFGDVEFDSANITHGTTKTETELRNVDTYRDGLGWGFSDVLNPDKSNPWVMPYAGGYPIFYWQQGSTSLP
jgi:hypothetical protein